MAAILVVDDDPEIVSLAQRRLEAAGHRVLSSGSAEGGLETASREPVDLILLDNVLPGMTGLMALPKFAQYSPGAVIFMTGHPNDDVRADALALGAAEFMPKPIDFERVESRLQGR